MQEAHLPPAADEKARLAKTARVKLGEHKVFLKTIQQRNAPLVFHEKQRQTAQIYEDLLNEMLANGLDELFYFDVTLFCFPSPTCLCRDLRLIATIIWSKPVKGKAKNMHFLF